MDKVKIDLWRKRVQGGEEIWVALRDSLRGNASEAVWAAGLNTLRLAHSRIRQVPAQNRVIDSLRRECCDL